MIESESSCSVQLCLCGGSKVCINDLAAVREHSTVGNRSNGEFFSRARVHGASAEDVLILRDEVLSRWNILHGDYIMIKIPNLPLHYIGQESDELYPSTEASFICKVQKMHYSHETPVSNILHACSKKICDYATSLQRTETLLQVTFLHRIASYKIPEAKIVQVRFPHLSTGDEDHSALLDRHKRAILCAVCRLRPCDLRHMLLGQIITSSVTLQVQGSTVVKEQSHIAVSAQLGHDRRRKLELLHLSVACSHDSRIGYKDTCYFIGTTTQLFFEMNDETMNKGCAFRIREGAWSTLSMLSPAENRNALAAFDLHEPQVCSQLIGLAESAMGSKEIVRGRGRKRNHLASPLSVLLLGPSGSGATSLVRAIAKHLGVGLVCVSSGCLLAEGRQNSDIALQAAILRAISEQPCIILLDDLDALIPRRQKADGQEQNSPRESFARIVINLIESIVEGSIQNNEFDDNSTLRENAMRVLVVGRAVERETIHEAVCSAFEETIHIPLPSSQQRERIVADLKSSLSANEQEAGSIDIDTLSSTLTGLPVAAFAAEAKFQIEGSLRSYRKRCEEGSTTFDSIAHLRNRESKLKLAGVAGHDAIKRALQEAVVWPRRHGHLFRRLGVPPEVGLLLFGPPGTGKTHMVRALSRELGCSLVELKLCDAVRGQIGAGEKAVVAAFREARRTAPSIIFIDEFQAIFTARNGSSGDQDSVGASLSAALAGCFDELAVWNNHAGCTAMITVIAATNEPWAVDTGFLRPGRFDRVLFVGPLDAAGRAHFLKTELLCVDSGDPSPLIQEPICSRVEQIKTRDGFCAGYHPEWLEEVVTRSEGYSGADMHLLLRKARSLLVEECESELKSESSSPSEHVVAGYALADTGESSSLPTDDTEGMKLHLRHFRRAFDTMTPTSSKKDIKNFLYWQKDMGN